MPTPRRRSPAVLLPAVLLPVALLLAVGCAAEPAAAPDGPPPASLAPMEPPPVGDVPRLSEVSGRTLPIEEYLLSGEQFRQYDRAQATLVTRCVRGFGLDYPGPATANTEAGALATETQTTHRYDPVELSDVSAHGYHAPDPSAGRKPSDVPSLSPDVTTVLGTGLGPGGRPAPGSAAAFHGRDLPPGGCIGAAQRELTAHGGTGRDSDVAVGINYEGFERSKADPRVRAVFRDWSRCMAEHGHDYPTPGDALKDPRWATNPSPSAEEISTATADVRCKEGSNVVGVWFTVETAYEEELIRRHQRELDAAKAANEAMLDTARAVVTP
ncbi:hypothetical protein [Kitasatospora sp. NPDC101183]|uniref:hypothetical protein n=1 Tax=Kitasatospora sp. NPDC101183 TaxID=3364100 RepID=UPI00382373BB